LYGGHSGFAIHNSSKSIAGKQSLCTNSPSKAHILLSDVDNLCFLQNRSLLFSYIFVGFDARLSRKIDAKNRVIL